MFPTLAETNEADTMETQIDNQPYRPLNFELNNNMLKVESSPRLEEVIDVKKVSAIDPLIKDESSHSHMQSRRS